MPERFWPLLRGAALLAILSASLLGSCLCGENYRYSAGTTLVDREVKIKIGLEAIVTSGLTRSGMLTNRSYKITVTLPGREAIEITNYTDKEVLSHEALKKRVREIKVRFSPDGKHLALDPGPFGKGVHFLHLMPEGPPFFLESFDKRLGVRRLSEVDWKQVPAPLELARRSMRSWLGKSEQCIEGILSSTLEPNMKSRPVAEAVLEVWPDCKDAHWLLDPLAKAKAMPEGLLEQLQQQSDAYLDKPKPGVHGLCGIASVSKLLGDTKRRDRAYRALVAHWPDPDVQTAFYVVKDLPVDVQRSLAARAKKILADPKREQWETDAARKVLKDLE